MTRRRRALLVAVLLLVSTRARGQDAAISETLGWKRTLELAAEVRAQAAVPAEARAELDADVAELEAALRAIEARVPGYRKRTEELDEEGRAVQTQHGAIEAEGKRFDA